MSTRTLGYVFGGFALSLFVIGCGSSSEPEKREKTEDVKSALVCDGVYDPWGDCNDPSGGGGDPTSGAGGPTCGPEQCNKIGPICTCNNHEYWCVTVTQCYRECSDGRHYTSGGGNSWEGGTYCS